MMDGLYAQSGSLIGGQKGLGVTQECCCPPQLCGCKTLPLPDTVTVSLSGFDETLLSDPLVYIQFAADFGGGATAVAATPVGRRLPDNKFEGRGPIKSATLLNPGSGYAKLGREEPTITAAVTDVPDASVSVTLEEDDDSLGLPVWRVDSVSVSGGEGFSEGMQIAFEASEGDTVVASASAVITTRLAPTITATAEGGSDASITVKVTQNEGQNNWSVTGISASAPGVGYPESGSITFAADEEDAVFEVMPAATFKCERVAPTISLSATGGSNAELTPVLSSAVDGDGNTYWTLASVTIDKAGAGYGKFAQIDRTIVDGEEDENDQFNTYIESVDGNGGITAVTVFNGGKMYKNTGEIESVSLTDSGLFYRETGQVQGVNLDGGGQYYRESKDATPYVADVTGSVAWQIFPSIGDGATFKAAVDDDPYSPNFGQLADVTVTKGGDAYLAFIELETCLTKLNGRDFVLAQSQVNPCQYRYACTDADGNPIAMDYNLGDGFGFESQFCEDFSQRCVAAVWQEGLVLSLSQDAVGDTETAHLDAGYIRFGEHYCDSGALRLASDCYPYNCTAMACVGDEEQFTLSRLGGGSAEVSAGGAFNPPECFSPLPEIVAGLEIEVQYLGRTITFTPGAEREGCSLGRDVIPFPIGFHPAGVGLGCNSDSRTGAIFLLASNVNQPACPIENPGGFQWDTADVTCGLTVSHQAPECSHWAVYANFVSTLTQPQNPDAIAAFLGVGPFKQLGAVPVDGEGYPSGAVDMYYDGPICVEGIWGGGQRTTECIEGAQTQLPNVIPNPGDLREDFLYPDIYKNISALRTMTVTFRRTLE